MEANAAKPSCVSILSILSAVQNSLRQARAVKRQPSLALTLPALQTKFLAQMKRLFAAEIADWRPNGGSMCEQAVVMAACKAGDAFVELAPETSRQLRRYFAEVGKVAVI